MKALLLLNGNSGRIIQANGLTAEEVRIIKIEEKDLSKPTKILRLLGREKYEAIYFGCIDLEYIRFQIFMKFYIFTSGGKGAIIDERGAQNEFSQLKFFFVDMPRVELEALVSLIIIPYYYIKFFFLRWKYLKRA